MPVHAGPATEIPAYDYDVVVFENRFPSFSHRIGRRRRRLARARAVRARPGRPLRGRLLHLRPRRSFATLPPTRVRTVIDAWADRTAELSALPDVEQVFCFENRGEEIGVTLHHPHGQIYAYPFVTPAHPADARSGAPTGAYPAATCSPTCSRPSARPASAWWSQQRALDRVRPGRRALAVRGAPLPAPAGADLAGADRRRARRVRTALPRRAAPPRRPVRRADALHRRPGTRPPCASTATWPTCTCELFSIRRAPGKLKYLAGSESAMGAFVNDVQPERAASMLREVQL